MFSKMLRSILSYKIMDFLQLIALVFSIANGSLAVANWVKGTSSLTDKVLIAFFVGIGFALLFGIIKLQTVNLSRFITISNEFYRISKLIRDEYQHLSSYPNQGQNQNLNIYETFRSTSQQFVESVQKVLKQSTGEEVSVCIKIFTLPAGHPRAGQTPGDYKVRTVCRSNNSEQDRSIEAVVCVKECKALKEIMERKPHFISTDLKKYNKEAQIQSLELYSDGAEPTYFAYYNSVIVVPIRICLDKPDSYKYLGFLWIDTPSDSAFRSDKYLKEYIKLIKAFADQFAHYLDRFFEKYIDP